MNKIRKAVFISDATHKRLKASALKHKRTLSAQVDYLLELAKKHETFR